MANFSITLDLDKSTPSIPGNPVRVRIGDLESCTIEAEILSGGAAFDLTGYAVRFECVKKDRTMVRDAGASASGNVITYTLSDAVATVEGRIERAYFAILKGSTVLDTTQDFAIDVLGNAESGSTGISESWYSEIDGVLDECADATADAQNATLNANAATSAANVAANEMQALLGQVVTVNSGNIPRGHATGDPVVVDDGYPSVLVDDPRTGDKALTLHGSSHQVVTEGKNLLPLVKGSYTGSRGVGVEVADDGVRLTGTATETGTSNIPCTMTLEPGTYTFGCENMDPVGDLGRLFSIYDSAWSGFMFYSNTETITVTERFEVAYLGFWVESGKTYNKTVRVQLESGSTATDYEPYTGGAPSPSPDYPQPITMLGARNLLPYPYHEKSQTENGITFTENGDGTITVNGTATANAWFIFSHYAAKPLSLKAGDYVLTGCPSGGSRETYFMAIGSDASTLVGYDIGSGARFFFDEDQSTVHSFIKIAGGTTVSNLTFKPMIRPAACEDDTWVPYGKVKVEARGKNLLPYPYSDSNKATNGITFTDNGDGTITASGTATDGAYFYPAKSGKGLTFPVGDYIVSGGLSGKQRIIVRVDETNIAYDNGEGASFTVTDPTAVYSLFIMVSANEVVNNVVFKPMIHRAEADATWVPYAKPSTALIDMQGYEVCELPDGTHDELVVDGEGNVSLVKRVGKVVLDGSEDEGWQIKETAEAYRFITYANDIKGVANDSYIPVGICDRLQPKSRNQTWLNISGFSYGTGTALYICVSSISTVEDFRAWLTENPVTLYYPLATPEIVSLGTVELPSLVSYGYNTVETDASLPCGTEATYQRDVNIALEKLTEALATAIADLA